MSEAELRAKLRKALEELDQPESTAAAEFVAPPGDPCAAPDSAALEAAEPAVAVKAGADRDR